MFSVMAAVQMFVCLAKAVQMFIPSVNHLLYFAWSVRGVQMVGWPVRAVQIDVWSVRAVVVFRKGCLEAFFVSIGSVLFYLVSSKHIYSKHPLL